MSRGTARRRETSETAPPWWGPFELALGALIVLASVAVLIYVVTGGPLVPEYSAFFIAWLLILVTCVHLARVASRQRAWATAIPGLRAQSVEPGRPYPSLAGLVEVFPIVVTVADRTVVSLRLDGELPPRLHARRGPIVPTWGYEIGDETFDAQVITWGARPTAVRALLGEMQRAALCELVASDGSIEDGSIRLPISIGPDATANLRLGVELCVRVARALRDGDGDLNDRLFQVAVRDPVAGVRLACASTIALEGSSANRSIMRELVRDPDPGIRVVAADGLKHEGFAVLKQVARDPAADPRLRELARRQSSPTRRSIVHALLHHPHPIANRVAIRESWRGDDAIVAGLAEHGAFGDPVTDLLGMNAIVRASAPSGESFLIETLGSRDERVRGEAIAALAKVGTALAVASLLAIASPDARRAVAAIQSRLGVKETGRLALAPEPAVGGELTDDAGGGELAEDGR